MNNARGALFMRRACRANSVRVPPDGGIPAISQSQLPNIYFAEARRSDISTVKTE